MDWLAAMCSHIPNRGEQMVRYYGYYSNVSRGKRQKEGNDDAIPCILERQGELKAFRKSWARLIQIIYEVDPLICPKCQGVMRIISFIEDAQVIRDILTIWDSGLSDQGRRQKSVPPSHYPIPKPPIPTRIHHIHTPTPTPTPNIPGMNIFSHNVL
jgi:hypothetical protein